MEHWRRELYHSELYHYGVKGMKWGKHQFGLKDKVSDFYKKRISGEYYLDNRSQIRNSPGRPNGRNNFKYGTGNYSRGYQGHRSDSHQLLTNAKWTRESADGYLGGRAEGLKAARRLNIEGRRSENRANQLLHNYKTRSLKGITETKIKRAKSWISSRPSAAKKKVSEIKDKIAWAQKGKQTISSPFDSKPKKQKKSTITVEEAFPSKKQDPKKYQRQRNNYRNMYR